MFANVCARFLSKPSPMIPLIFATKHGPHHPVTISRQYIPYLYANDLHLMAKNSQWRRLHNLNRRQAGQARFSLENASRSTIIKNMAFGVLYMHFNRPRFKHTRISSSTTIDKIVVGGFLMVDCFAPVSRYNPCISVSAKQLLQCSVQNDMLYALLPFQVAKGNPNARMFYGAKTKGRGVAFVSLIPNVICTEL